MGATLPERRHELARHLRFGATLLERDPEVARHLRFGATSKSDKVKLLQLLERPHHSDTQRSLGLCRFESNEQAGSDVPQRLPEVAPSTQSDLLERRAEVAPRLLFAGSDVTTVSVTSRSALRRFGARKILSERPPRATTRSRSSFRARSPQRHPEVARSPHELADEEDETQRLRYGGGVFSARRQSSGGRHTKRNEASSSHRLVKKKTQAVAAMEDLRGR
ncbi:hypothetical protein F2Q70_00005091 [Brassica cretica]|uniref:Uncharacterized protein n=1 Tax=Brassica cretica TaxID=69181 RepID=A0A8S9IU94_BRACR|nr:hypothetical protein F2Q70_00005091 [Brassica cretica]